MKTPKCRLDKIEYLKSKPESTEYEIGDDEFSKLKIEYNILKHELNITNLKLTLKNDPKKKNMI